uniref:Nucleotide exchange factor Fes1 domain-containing protein n=1 Tax=Onchocerca volvulus TaxID=6282 RepID=A0A8R1XN97_ONCVO
MGEQNVVSPQCWSKLLCLAQSANNGSGEKSSQLMPKQDQKFVENAMAEAMHLTDPVRHMTKHIEQLKLIGKTSKDDVDNVKEIVDSLEELVCDIDYAADFCKLNGLVEVIRLMKSDCDSVRCEMTRLIPLLAQNNPYVQDVILQTDLLPYLLTILEEINASEDLLAKSLSSLSSIVRTHEKAFRQFYQLKGLEKFENVFRKAVDMHYFKVADKAVLVTTSIAISLGPDVKQYNVFPVLFRMALQLSPDSAGCSYFLDYLMNNITDKEDNSGFTSDEFKMNLIELDNQSKRQLYDFLERQLKHEGRLPHEDCLRSFLKKMDVILNEDTKNVKFEVSKTSSNS